MAAFGLLAGIFTSLGKISPSKWKGFQGAMSSVSEAAQDSPGLQSILSSLTSALDIISDIFKPFIKLIELFGNILRAQLAPVFTKLFETLFSPEILALITKIAEVIAALIIPVFEIFISILNKLVESGIFEAIIAILDIFINAFTRFWDSIQPIVDVLLDLFMMVLTVFVTLLDALAPIINELLEIFIEILVAGISAIIEILEPLMPYIIKALEWLVSILQWVADNSDQIIGTIRDGFEWFINGIIWLKDKLNDFWNDFIAGFKFFVNFFINMINDAINLLNMLDIADVFEDIPTIPTLQGGGLIEESGIARVHAGEGVLTPDELAILQGAITNNNYTTGETRTTNINITAMALDDDNIETIARRTAQVITLT